MSMPVCSYRVRSRPMMRSFLSQASSQATNYDMDPSTTEESSSSSPTISPPQSVCFPRKPPKSSQFFKHRDMVSQMMATADRLGRDFLDDVMSLIAIHYTQGTNNLQRIASSMGSRGDMEAQWRLQAMAEAYGIRTSARYCDRYPTLGRIAEALPHLSLVLCDRLASGPKPTLRAPIADEDLGAAVELHFRMSYFPGLIDVDTCGPQGEVGLLLFNLCQALAVVKTSGARLGRVQAFAASCKYTTSVMGQQLAPAETRIRFTRFVERTPISAETLEGVWRRVLGDAYVATTETTSVTQFHQCVYRAQPLSLGKWRQLLRENGTRKRRDDYC